MTALKKKILAGTLGYFGTFITSVTTYLAGIRDQGGTLQDVEWISIALFALIAIGGGVASLGALLAKSPNDKQDEISEEL